MLKNYCLLILGLSFVVANIFLSQNLDSGYFKVANGDEKSFANLLIKIKALPDFNTFYSLGQKIYGTKIEEDVFQEQIKMEKEILRIQSLLTLNPKQKYLLYNLYLLYQQKGDTHQAQEYLNKAKLIDPTVK